MARQHEQSLPATLVQALTRDSSRFFLGAIVIASALWTLWPFVK